MSYYNRITLVGNVVGAPELKRLQNGTPMCKLTVAVRRDGPADPRERETDTFNVTAWGKQAEFCGKNVHNGDKVLVDGKMKFNRWVARDGSERYYPEVSALRVILMWDHGPRSVDEEHDELPEIDDEVSFDV